MDEILHHLRNPGIMIPPENTNQQWFVMVSRWCRILSIRSMNKSDLLLASAARAAGKNDEFDGGCGSRIAGYDRIFASCSALLCPLHTQAPQKQGSSLQACNLDGRHPGERARVASSIKKRLRVFHKPTHCKQTKNLHQARMTNVIVSLVPTEGKRYSADRPIGHVNVCLRGPCDSN